MNANAFQIPNFSLYFSNINKNQNDGVMIFTHKSLIITSSIEISVQSHTALGIQLKKWNTTLIIYAIYRSPNSNIGLFIDELENLILLKAKTSKADYKTIIGDINIDLLTDTINQKKISVINGRI
jgi:hypothetical protein